MVGRYYVSLFSQNIPDLDTQFYELINGIFFEFYLVT